MVKLSWCGFAVLSHLSRIFLANLLKDYNKFKKCLKRPLPLIPTLFPNSFTPISFIQHTPPPRLSKLATKMFKLYFRRKLHIEARNFLLSRYSNVKFHFSTSPALFDTLHQTPTKVIPPASRLAILRWSIDSEPDVHFRLRRHISRLISVSLRLWLHIIFVSELGGLALRKSPTEWKQAQGAVGNSQQLLYAQVRTLRQDLADRYGTCPDHFSCLHLACETLTILVE